MYETTEKISGLSFEEHRDADSPGEYTHGRIELQLLVNVVIFMTFTVRIHSGTDYTINFTGRIIDLFFSFKKHQLWLIERDINCFLIENK